MKKLLKKWIAIPAALIMAGGLVLVAPACGGGNSLRRNPYSVATGLGYEETIGKFMAETQGSSTESYRLYEDAKKDGYSGSFVDFLKELGSASDPVTATNRALMSTVMVVCNFERNSSSIFGQNSEAYSAMGGGIIYSLDREKGDALVLTNYHVIYNEASKGTTKSKVCEDIDLYLYGGVTSERKIDATYVGGAMQYDIAVLKIEGSEELKNSSCVAATIGNSDAVSVGEKVYAIGNPDASGFSVTSGVVSVDAEYIDIDLADGSASVSMLEIRTDAPINHGNSGGGLYNERGELVGIVNARSERSGVEHFGYAIPVNLAIAVGQNIIDNSRVNSSQGALRAMLGITVSTTDKQGVFDEDAGRAYILETVTVQDVSLGTVSFGKLHKGDVLYSVKIGDGPERIITRQHILTTALFDVRKGDTVKLTVSRGEETVTLEFEFADDKYFNIYD